GFRPALSAQHIDQTHQAQARTTKTQPLDWVELCRRRVRVGMGATQQPRRHQYRSLGERVRGDSFSRGRLTMDDLRTIGERSRLGFTGPAEAAATRSALGPERNPTPSVSPRSGLSTVRGRTAGSCPHWARNILDQLHPEAILGLRRCLDVRMARERENRATRGQARLLQRVTVGYRGTCRQSHGQ
ncbi:unnamed protein product, partial [Ectocarpus fasciculatus]